MPADDLGRKLYDLYNFLILEYDPHGWYIINPGADAWEQLPEYRKRAWNDIALRFLKEVNDATRQTEED